MSLRKGPINTIMLVTFLVSFFLFCTLGVSVIILGPKNTDKSLRALFKTKNYFEKYEEVYPSIIQYENSEVQGEEDKVFDTERQVEDKTKSPALIIPSSGIAPSTPFLFTGPLSEGKHEGIDIWTNTNGTGMDGKTYGKGNPVYAACSGTVRTVWPENGDVSIICDPLDPFYEGILPSLQIKTLYGHMADQFSNKVYIYVSEGQRVQTGDLIGHQGNRCYWAPKNKVVHLHFGVYDITKPKQVPMDPTPYIGVSCTTLNQTFEAGRANN